MTLSAARIAEALGGLGQPPGRIVRVVEITGSTNDDARQAAAAGAPSGAAFVADAQSLGRGRAGRTWHSPPGRNLYLSLILRPELAPERVAPLALAVGVAVARLVDGVLRSAFIKWPNDVMVDGKKIAGILIEATSHGAEPPVLVVGVGLNVHGTSFPGELADTASSLAALGGQALDRSALAAALIVAIEDAAASYRQAGLAGVKDELERRDLLRGRAVRAGELTGIARGIDERGRLRLEDDAGTVHAIVSGHVEWAQAPP